MAVKLRLVRMGKKKQPTYRVVAADSRSPRDGRFLEVVGTYAPRGRSTSDADAVVTIDHDKALRWLRDGAQPTERVERLLRGAGTFDLLAGGSPGSPASSTGTAAPEATPAPPEAEDSAGAAEAPGAAGTAGAPGAPGADVTSGAAGTGDAASSGDGDGVGAEQ